MNFNYQKMKTPAGWLYLVEGGGQLYAVVFQKQWPAVRKRFGEPRELKSPVLKTAKEQLTEYFQRKRKSFDLPLQLGGTPFQKRVWLSLAKIPHGETSSYKEQAARLQAPTALRAVGRTNGLNILCIVLPCHRVVGSNGALTGYAGGLSTKRFLLALENG